MGALQWFRLYHRIIDDEKIRLLAFEDRWHFVALCCLKADGLLDEADSQVKWRKIAVKMGVQARELDEIRRRLAEVDLVDEDMVPTAWDDLQYRSDTSTDRVKRFREKQKKNKDETPRNVSVTPQEAETDTEATLSSVASAPPPDELDQLQAKLLDAVGEGNIHPHGALDLSAILGLTAAGVDLETDILPTIRARASRLTRPVRSWAYFTDAIRDAYNRRIEAGQGLSKPKVSTIKPDPEMTPEELRAAWAKRLNFGRMQRQWFPFWGPMPGQPGCTCPPDLLEPKDGQHPDGSPWDIRKIEAA